MDGYDGAGCAKGGAIMEGAMLGLSETVIKKEVGLTTIIVETKPHGYMSSRLRVGNMDHGVFRDKGAPKQCLRIVEEWEGWGRSTRLLTTMSVPDDFPYAIVRIHDGNPRQGTRSSLEMLFTPNTIAEEEYGNT